MAVKISQGSAAVYSLTSRPEQPDPYPPEEFIAQGVEYPDREILVSIPFPDTVELTADILNDHHITPDTSKKSLKQVYAALDEEILAALPEICASLPNHITCSKLKKSEAVFMIRYSELEPLHRARIELRRKEGTDFGSWRVRLEFSASKAGPSGLVKLIAAMSEVLPFLQVETLFPDFRVSRVDPAIDLIGARPLDLIAHIPHPGKRLVYVGEDGAAETIYLYQKKQPLKKPPASLSYSTLGTLRLKLYERKAYCEQLKLPAPYGGCPVTRAETQVRWKKKSLRPLLKDFAGISNLMIGRRVAYAPAVVDQLKLPNPRDWLRYCLATFGGGVGKSQSKWPLGAGLKYRHAYFSCGGDLINDAAWERWPDGLAYTGLAEWIKLAQKS